MPHAQVPKPMGATLRPSPTGSEGGDADSVGHSGSRIVVPKNRSGLSGLPNTGTSFEDFSDFDLDWLVVRWAGGKGQFFGSEK